MTYTHADAELAYGPLCPAERPELKARFEAIAGLDLTQEQWVFLSKGSKKAAQIFLWETPRTAESRKRIERLRLATLECHAALCDVIENSPDTIDPTAPPAEIDLASDLDEASIDADEHLLDSDALLSEAARLVGIIRAASERTVLELKIPPVGAGRKTHGYDEFLDACRIVWISRMGDAKGYSTRLGRGSGAFVKFVWAGEFLLPMMMRRLDVEKVGDAVIRHFGR